MALGTGASTVKAVQSGKRQPEPLSPRSRSAPHRQWPQYKGPRRRKQEKRRRSFLPMIIGGSVVLGFIGLEIGPPLVGCNVKGNINYNAGQRFITCPARSITGRPGSTGWRENAGSAQRTPRLELDGVNLVFDTCVSQTGPLFR